ARHGSRIWAGDLQGGAAPARRHRQQRLPSDGRPRARRRRPSGAERHPLGDRAADGRAVSSDGMSSGAYASNLPPSEPARMTRPKSVLITGATANLETKLRRHFAEAGRYELRLLCKNPEQDPAVVTADLSLYDEGWARQFADVYAVIHLAG